MTLYVIEINSCDGKRKNIYPDPGMEILRKEKSPFNKVTSPTTKRWGVVIYILRRTSFHQQICLMTQEELKTGHYDCILDVLWITMTVSILHDLI